MLPNQDISRLKKIEQLFPLIKRLHNLFKSKILWENSFLVYRQSVFCEVLIHLNELLKCAKKDGKPIVFAEDVRIQDDISDVSDLVRYYTIVFCHGNTDHGNGSAKYIPIEESRGRSSNISHSVKESKYADDIAFFAGNQILYLKRHLERAFFEVRSFYLSEHKGIFQESVGNLFDETYYNTAFTDWFQ